ncbi:MAG: hypothetical protein ACHREM_01610 [Polyangiales bacterium]
MSTATHVKHDTRRRRFFPFTLMRFRGLRGGTTGDVSVVARSRKVLEVQLGEDWVQFKREDVFALMNAIQAFLAFDEKFRERVMRLELAPDERRILDELIAAYKLSEEGRADAHERRDEDEASTSGEATSADDDESAPTHPAHAARKPRRRSN